MDGEPVAVIVGEGGLNVELRYAGPITAGDTVGVYAEDRVCATNVKEKTYEDSDDVPFCQHIENAYER